MPIQQCLYKEVYQSIKDNTTEKSGLFFLLSELYIYKTERHNKATSFFNFLKLTDTLHFGGIVILSLVLSPARRYFQNDVSPLLFSTVPVFPLPLTEGTNFKRRNARTVPNVVHASAPRTAPATGATVQVLVQPVTPATGTTWCAVWGPGSVAETCATKETIACVPLRGIARGFFLSSLKSCVTNSGVSLFSLIFHAPN